MTATELDERTPVRDFFAWAKFIIGLIFVPDVRRATRRALDEWASAPEPRADAPTVDPEWEGRRIQARRNGEDIPE